MKKIQLVLSGLLLVGLLITSWFLYQSRIDATALDSLKDTSKQLFEKKEPVEDVLVIPEPEVFTTSIGSTGDILMHTSVYEDAQLSDGSYDFKPMFEKVKPYLSDVGVLIANSESIIGGTEVGVSSYPRFNSPYEVGDALKDAGVDVAVMANNHTLDRGEQAVLNALQHWKKIGIVTVGAHATPEEAEEIKTITKDGITFSLLSYTYGTNGIPLPKDKPYLVNVIDMEKIKNQVAQAKTMSDVVVMNLHIGDEYKEDFNDYQDKTAQQLADMGVDIVFAHHPHVLQPAKWYTGVNGNRTFVMHSLGNFISAQRELPRKIGAMIKLNVTKTVTYDEEGKSTSSVTIDSPQMLLTYAKDTNWRNYDIIPMTKLTENDLNNAQKIYDKTKQHVSKYASDITFVE